MNHIGQGLFQLVLFSICTIFAGAAHGMCGVLQSLLNFPFYLHEEPEACNLIRRSIDYLLELCKEKRNIATNIGAALSGQGKYLVHWCHGAAGKFFSCCFSEYFCEKSSS